MKLLRSLQSLVLALGFALASFAAQAGTFYGTDSSGQLITLSPTNAATVAIGPNSAKILVGAAYNANTSTL